MWGGPATRKRDEIVDGQKIGLVAQLGDERELVLDLRSDFGRHALGPALLCTPLGQSAQMSTRGLAGGHELPRDS